MVAKAVIYLTFHSVWMITYQGLSWVYTSSFRMRLPHCVAIFYNLPWFCSIKVSYKKLQCNVENACGNRMCKFAFTNASLSQMFLTFTLSSFFFRTLRPFSNDSKHFSNSMIDLKIYFGKMCKGIIIRFT